MNDLMLYGFMILIAAFIIFAIVRSQSYSNKNYMDISRHYDLKFREATKPLAQKRSKEIWNRLNPKIYLDDDATEPLPEMDKKRHFQQSKS